MNRDSKVPQRDCNLFVCSCSFETSIESQNHAVGPMGDLPVEGQARRI